ncbi:hypothetical protein RJ641_016456 [Dillenia turbinata]|uniref:WIT1/2 N-terminal helical bundle domain-containing protein n=1 Tax=Dillenia turbinata TaxID=194707 RepID=A0AAN8URV8_9MAGN
MFDWRLLQLTNGDMIEDRKKKKEEEETVLDGEFIKVDKDSFDVKEGSLSHSHDTPSVLEPSSSNSTATTTATRELLESQEKVHELGLELVRISEALKQSESENALLKEEVLLTKGELEQGGRKFEHLDLDHKKLQQQIIEAEEKYNLQLNALQEALQALEAKDKELTDIKESSDRLSLELQDSLKKMQQLEQELQSSAGKAMKFEQLCQESGKHAESETQRALEFEKMLQVAKLSAKEMEDQMATLQEELKNLYEKIAENQKVEEALKGTTAELSAAQEELRLSKFHALEIEQKLFSKEGLIKELSEELELKKASEYQLKEDISALQNLLSSTKEDLRVKVSELEEIKLELQEEVKQKEEIKVGYESQEAQLVKVQEELASITQERGSLEAAIADLTSNAAMMKELCADLEQKLKLSDENFRKTDSLLSQALSNNTELEHKLKSLEELHHESGNAAATAAQRSLELEDLVKASTVAAEEAQLQLQALETRSILAEQKNAQLGQQLNLVELKYADAERELKDCREKMSELSIALKEVEDEKKKMNGQMQLYEEKIAELESALEVSSTRHSQLEVELKSLNDKCAKHEGHANTHYQRALELEDLMKITHSKVEDFSKREQELELLLETEKFRIQELEAQISTLQQKCMHAEEESDMYSAKASELAAELQASLSKASNLEASLQLVNEKERELTDSLNTLTEEKKGLEEASNNSNKKLAEVENTLEVLRNELSFTQGKLESIEKDLVASGIQESKIMEKLKSAEEQLQQQERVLEQATSRNMELESLHETLAKDSELKLQEAMVNFTSKDTEAKTLYEKLQTLEDKVKSYEVQIVEATEVSAALKKELEQSLMKLGALETTNRELQTKISEEETKVAQSYSENELLVETNSQLNSKVNELEELLSSATNEKEMVTEQLASHVKTIADLTDQHSKVSELHSIEQARSIDVEIQLQEAMQKYMQKDSESKDLHEKLIALEAQIKEHEAKACDASETADVRKAELEETLLKLRDLESVVEQLQSKADHFQTQSEGLAEENLKLTQELAEYESKMNDLEGKLSEALLEKDGTVEQLNHSKKAIEDLTQQLSLEGQKLQSRVCTSFFFSSCFEKAQKLQSQVVSLIEEKNLLNETYQDAKQELQAVILQLEGQLKEHKANEDSLKADMENIKAESAEKTALQTRCKELEDQLVKAEARLREEVENVRSAAAVREAELTLSLEAHAQKLCDRDSLSEQVLQLQKDLSLAQATISEQKEASSKDKLENEAKNQQVILLEKQLKELEKKLQLAAANLKEKDGGDEKEVKSREIGASISTPTSVRRKSKKKLEAASGQTPSPPETQTKGTDVSPAMTFKFVVGVALVSIIVGIILGKRY